MRIYSLFTVSKIKCFLRHIAKKLKYLKYIKSIYNHRKQNLYLTATEWKLIIKVRIIPFLKYENNDKHYALSALHVLRIS